MAAVTAMGRAMIGPAGALACGSALVRAMGTLAAGGAPAAGEAAGPPRERRRRAASGASAAPAPALFEMRTYTLHPSMAGEYLRRTEEAGALRKRVLPGMLGFWSVEAGGQLATVKHLYSHRSMAARAETRRAMGGDGDWQGYLSAAMPCVAGAHAEIFSECPDVMRAASSPASAADFSPPPAAGPGVYELREYQLVAGYGSVGKLREAFVRGLGSKVAADVNGRLAFFGYTEFGVLNKVIEVWRYPSAEACIQGRIAARKATEWREVVGTVAPYADRFQSQIMTPLGLSPWQ